MVTRHGTRESWLNDAVRLLVPLFEERGFKVPSTAVSCGFPSTGARSGHIGQCWSTKASKAGINEIFVSPVIDDPVQALDVLVHELVHAVDNCANKHGAPFRRVALAVGLAGKMREASAGPELKARLEGVARQLGHYPHHRLSIAKRTQVRPPRPRARCDECGYEITPLKKWLSYGPPICPRDRVEMTPVGDWESD